jgi:hypothetical protein
MKILAEKPDTTTVAEKSVAKKPDIKMATQKPDMILAVAKKPNKIQRRRERSGQDTEAVKKSR